MDRKGAIQVSIGFLIVMVISALVMIFMFSWLGSIFPQLTLISTYATDQAKDKMMDEFARGGDAILATIPTQQTFAPSSLVPFKVGVRKTAEYDDMDIFTICIGKLTSTSCSMAADPDNEDELLHPDPSVDIKFFVPRAVGIKTRGEIALSDARMQIGSGVTEGLYGFRLYVCAEPDSGESSNDENEWECTGLGESYGQYSFIVEVK